MNKSYKLILIFFALLGAFVLYSGIAGSGNVKMAKMEKVGNEHKAVNSATPIVNSSPLQQTESATPIVDNSSSPQTEEKQPQQNSEEEEEEGC